MRRSPYLLASALLLSSLHPVQHQARADIPFLVTNSVFDGAGNGVDVSGFLCNGPWFRTSGQQDVPANTQNSNFYTVVDNIFSPWGPWHCEVESPPVGIDFCLVDVPFFAGVQLALRGAYFASSISSNMPSSCNGATEAVAFLGDAVSPGQLDQDGFRFDGKAGDRVTVRLERDLAKGSTGEIAHLSLRGERGGVLGQRQGAVPFELTVTLPQAGSYEIEAAEVAEHAAGSGGPFRGFYRLMVTSSNAGAALKLEPLRSTEP